MRTEDLNTPFKNCPTCRHNWLTRESFLEDPDTILIGYQAHFNNAEEGLFLFNHHVCKSTIAIKSGRFTDLYNGPVYTENKAGEEDCPGYCLYKSNMQACPAKCSCAYVRDVLQQIRSWKKIVPIKEPNSLD